MDFRQFFRRFEGRAFSWRCRRRSDRYGTGVHCYIGRGGDFFDHRAYDAGDDARDIDWPAYGRTGRLLTKIRASEGVLPIRVLLDVSASMQAGEGRVARSAALLAGALAASLVIGGDAARLEFFSERLIHCGPWIYRRDEIDRLWLAGVRQAAQPADGVTAWEEFIPQVVERGEEHIAASAKAPLVIISDFWGGDAAIDACRRLAASGREILAVQILGSADRQPPWRGLVTFQDAETHQHVPVEITRAIVENYRKDLTQRVLALQAACRLGGGESILISPSYSWQEAVVACWQKRGFQRNV